MADVEMKDADTPTTSKGKEAGDKKPRFEVKKVRLSTHPSHNTYTLQDTNCYTSGTLLPYGRGTSSSKPVPFVETTSWSCVLNVKPIRLRPL
jgi:hypothetical protein